MLTDIEIAQSCVMQPIEKIADTLGLTPDLLEPYGRYKAKGGLPCFEGSSAERQAGAGHSHQSDPGWRRQDDRFHRTGRRFAAGGIQRVPRASRTVSRPCFRREGRRGGGGYAQVVPMEDINLHFTATCTPSRRRTT